MVPKAAGSPSPPALRRFAWLVAGCTLGLVFAGGLVTSKEAGLAVPDWPLSFGSLNPERWWEIENIRAEHGHRLIAGGVGLLTLALTVAVWRARPDGRARWVAAAALGTVLLQALIGGLTVLGLELRPFITVVHALVGQGFFCLTVVLAVMLSPRWRPREARSPAGRPPATSSRASWKLPTSALGLSFTLIVIAQLAVGAAMRHAEAGLAIPDFPLAYGRLAPALDAEGMARIDAERRRRGLPQATAAQIRLHYTHRLGALLVALAATGLGLRVLRDHRDRGEILFPTLLILGLVAFQLVLGALVIWSRKQPHLATLHVAVGAIILAAACVLTLEAFRLRSATGAVPTAVAGSRILSRESPS